MNEGRYNPPITNQPLAEELYSRALETIAGGVGHDLRRGHPVPLYIARAAGSRKWDEDAREYIDYGMGNAALLLGHAPLEVCQRVSPTRFWIQSK